MILASCGEIAFEIFGYPIHYYGIIMGLSIFCGIMLSYFICKRFFKELNPDVIFDVAIPVIIGAIIGARLYYCLFAYDYYFSHPINIVKIYEGGLSIHGAIIGGVIAGAVYTKNKKLPFLKLCDIFSFGLVLGQVIGRWGNFFNNEAFGRPYNGFIKLFVPENCRPFGYENFEYFHPTFLYESILNIFILLILFLVLKYSYSEKKSGKIFFTYLICYSIVRFCIESIRIDSVFNIANIPLAQIVSLIILFFSLLCMYRKQLF